MVCDDDENMEDKQFFSDSNNPTMESSDEDYLPDPERPRKRKEPPDRGEASGSREKKSKQEEDDNKQSGLDLHDDFIKGRCFFFFK